MHCHAFYDKVSRKMDLHESAFVKLTKLSDEVGD